MSPLFQTNEHMVSSHLALAKCLKDKDASFGQSGSTSSNAAQTPSLTWMFLFVVRNFGFKLNSELFSHIFCICRSITVGTILPYSTSAEILVHNNIIFFFDYCNSLLFGFSKSPVLLVTAFVEYHCLSSNTHKEECTCHNKQLCWLCADCAIQYNIIVLG